MYSSFMKHLNRPDLGKLLIRVALGIVFINAGFMKIGMIDLVASSFQSIGIPAFLAYVVSYFELIGGIALVLGLFTRSVSLVFVAIMFVAMFKVHWAGGYSLANNGYEYVLTLMLVSAALVTLGGGKYSVRRLINR